MKYEAMAGAGSSARIRAGANASIRVPGGGAARRGTERQETADRCAYADCDERQYFYVQVDAGARS